MNPKKSIFHQTPSYRWFGGNTSDSNKKPACSIEEYFVAFALIAYPSTVLVIKNANGLLFGILALLGIWLLLRQKTKPASNKERLIYISIIFFFLASQVSTLSTGLNYGTTGKFIHLLLAIPIYIFLKRVEIKPEALWFGLVLGSYISAGVAFYEVWLGAQRASSLTHPIIFGALSLMMGILSLAGIGWFKKKSPKYTLFPILACLLSTVASALSMSRGAWVAIPFFTIVFIWYSREYISAKYIAIASLLFVTFISLIYVVPQTGVKSRIDVTIQNISSYAGSGINDPQRSTSIGTRFEMWQASWQLFIDNPVLGVGWRNYTKEAKKLVDDGIRNKSAISFPHPHNQFFSHMASGGILGIASLLAIFLIPAYFFVKTIKQPLSDDAHRLAFAGLLLIIGYMCFGLSEAIFERSRPINFFAFYIAVFLAAIHHAEKTQPKPQ